MFDRKRDAAAATRDLRLVLTTGGRGASVVEIGRSGDGFAARVLASERSAPEAPPAEALARALAAARPSRGTATPLLGEVVVRSRLAAVPPADEATQRALLAHDGDPDDVIATLSVGDVVEGGRTLAGTFAFAARRGDLRAVADAAEAGGLTVEEPIAFDRLLMSFARARAGDTAGSTRVVALLEPGWIDLVCVADGRALFVRRVEVASEAAAEDRLGSVVTEAQKTALVVRGRLRPPPLSGCTVVDPLGLLAGADVAAASEASGLELDFRPLPLVVDGASHPAALGDAVRACAVECVRREGGLRACALPFETRVAARSRAGRFAAAAACVVAVWGGSFALRGYMADEARTMRAAVVAPAAVAAPADDAVLRRRAEERSAAATFGADHAAALEFASRAPSAAALLAAVAEAAPDDAALTSLEMRLDEDGAVRRVRCEGFVRSDFAAARAVVRRFGAGLRATPGLADVEERTVDAPPETAAARADRVLTPFAFSFAAQESP
jgi:hypothetical protein